MNKIKNILIILNILFILIIAGLIIYVVKLNKSKEVDSTTKDLITTCTKTIQEEKNIKTYITENIYYDSNNTITAENSKVTYEINDDVTYQSIINKLSNCTDSYKEDKKIICELEINEDVKKIFGTWAYKYIEGAKTDGFNCETK